MKIAVFWGATCNSPKSGILLNMMTWSPFETWKGRRFYSENCGCRQNDFTSVQACWPT